MNQTQLQRFLSPVRAQVLTALAKNIGNGSLTFNENSSLFSDSRDGGFGVMNGEGKVVAFVPCGPHGAVKIVRGVHGRLTWEAIQAAEKQLIEMHGFRFSDFDAFEFFEHFILRGFVSERRNVEAPVEVRALFLHPLDAAQLFVDEASELVH